MHQAKSIVDFDINETVIGEKNGDAIRSIDLYPMYREMIRVSIELFKTLRMVEFANKEIEKIEEKIKRNKKNSIRKVYKVKVRRLC